LCNVRNVFYGRVNFVNIDATWTAGATAVPEPATLALLSPAAIALIAIRPRWSGTARY